MFRRSSPPTSAFCEDEGRGTRGRSCTCVAANAGADEPRRLHASAAPPSLPYLCAASSTPIRPSPPPAWRTLAHRQLCAWRVIVPLPACTMARPTVSAYPEATTVNLFLPSNGDRGECVEVGFILSGEKSSRVRPRPLSSPRSDPPNFSPYPPLPSSLFGVAGRGRPRVPVAVGDDGEEAGMEATMARGAGGRRRRARLWRLGVGA